MRAPRRVWQPGTYRPEDLQARISELLAVAQERARADREAGRVAAADDGDELVVCVVEYMRGAGETFHAMEHALLSQLSSGATH